MRKVLFKKWNRMDGKLCLDEDFVNVGLFHQWASSFEDGGEAGFGNYTVALVESSDGTISEVLPDHIKFIV